VPYRTAAVDLESTLRSRLGFGGWGLGGKASGILGYGPIDVEKTIKLICQAIDKSITFFDTSPAYGDGMSENILGQATEGKRKSIFLASKIGTTNFRESQNFQLPQLRHSLDETLYG
jgi:aryl-alcohol dehydrogenase-like predicted oxidoreductase